LDNKLEFVSEDYIKNYIDKIKINDASQLLKILEKRRYNYSLEDFLILIAPATEKYLDVLAKFAAHIKTQRFGKTIKLYAPIYVSNYCCNDCAYCGFRISEKKEQRRHLTLSEIDNEARILKNQGFDNILIVSGEDRKKITIDYLSDCVKLLKKYFSYIAIEVYPLEKEEYKILINAGVEGLTLYQETYNNELYKEYHKAGSKKNFEKRLAAPAAAAAAGMRDIGLGALLGLNDWRFEAAALFQHSKFLMKNYWQTRINFSFPRIRPAVTTFKPKFEITDKNLAQMICALRIAFPDAQLVLSTRESAKLRDKLINLGITQISAGSKTKPGGYMDDILDKNKTNNSVEQFEVFDNRSVKEVVDKLIILGYDPVFKDWDITL